MNVKPIPENISVTVDREEILLPASLQESINAHWDALTKERPSLVRGDIYSIKQMSLSEEELKVTLQKTDYAHFLFSQQLSEDHIYRCRGVVANGVFLTRDGYFVIGEMNAHTSTPGRLQFVAGGVEESDFQEDVVHVLASLLRESQEEVGIDLTDSALISRITPKYMVLWQAIALIYLIELTMDSYQLKLHYHHFENELLRQKIIPEFASLVFVHTNQVSAFLREDPRWKLDFLPKVLEDLNEELSEKG